MFLKARNALAAWCPYLLHGIADEELAYKNLGADFLHMSKVLIPWIVLCEKVSSSDDIITLYTLIILRQVELAGGNGCGTKGSVRSGG